MIFYSSLSKGIFPKQLKVSNVSSNYKVEKIKEVGNFRPKSLVIMFSKVLESIQTHNQHEHSSIEPNWPNYWTMLWVLYGAFDLMFLSYHVFVSHFINPHSLVAWIPRNSLLETGAKLAKWCSHLNFRYHVCFE